MSWRNTASLHLHTAFNGKKILHLQENVALARKSWQCNIFLPMQHFLANARFPIIWQVDRRVLLCPKFHFTTVFITKNFNVVFVPKYPLYKATWSNGHSWALRSSSSLKISSKFRSGGPDCSSSTLLRPTIPKTTTIWTTKKFVLFPEIWAVLRQLFWEGTATRLQRGDGHATWKRSGLFFIDSSEANNPKSDYYMNSLASLQRVEFPPCEMRPKSSSFQQPLHYTFQIYIQIYIQKKIYIYNTFQTFQTIDLKL